MLFSVSRNEINWNFIYDVIFFSRRPDFSTVNNLKKSGRKTVDSDCFPLLLYRSIVFPGWIRAELAIVPVGSWMIRGISMKFPVCGSFRNIQVPGTDNSGRNTASMFRWFFRPETAGNTPETAGRSRKNSRFRRVPAGSGPRNERPGTIYIFLYHVGTK